ncbi:MAG: hypothetical protein NC489_45610 [Ruminococcus flavefaciens]|nr:hypothetical protein [Ruminococcus flavefaciens]
MKKYNLSEIMKNAWARFRELNAPYNYYRGYGEKKIVHFSFSYCLKAAWAKAKQFARTFTGLVKNVQVGGTLCHPVLVNVDMDDLTVTGNTYPARKIMREFGLDWDKENKAWIGSRENLNKLCWEYV